jgi:hypothetical protein
MHHAIFVHDPNAPLLENFEHRPLRDDESVMQRPVDQHGAGLTVTEQAVRVRKIRAEGDSPGIVVEFGLDRDARAGVLELAAVGQLEFDSRSLLILTHVGHVFEVAGLGYVEINPHHAVIGQGREGVSLDQAALPLLQAVNDAVERCSDVGKV